MSNPAPPNLQAQLDAFVKWRKTFLTGDEKGEAQVFCDHLFQAFGYGGLHEAGATLEQRLKKHDRGGTAFADLMWKPRCLIEMKKSGTDLSKHFRQAFDYWVLAVPNRPRYVILCNFDEFWVYDFENQVEEPVDKLKLEDLAARRDVLAFMLPEPEQPVFGNDLVAVTREAAAQVGLLFRELTERGAERLVAQRFVLQSVMAMFSEDIGLLPGKFFTRALEDEGGPQDVYDRLLALFNAMNTPGITPAGRLAGTPYFNGGLFADVSSVLLTTAEVHLLHTAAVMDWSSVRPEIFGTLFEGSMEAGERHATGAHFTSQADIAKVVGPTIVAPWRARLEAAGSIPELEKLMLDMFNYRVLDPACGSGNFLYVAYREMRRLEHEARALIAAKRRSARGAQASLSYVTPDHFFGFDTNPFAVEVAKVTMMLGKKLAADELDELQEVLPLDNLDGVILARDALFTEWPAVDAIIGNPPYLGRRKMAAELGAAYTNKLSTKYPDVGGVSDFVTYWFPLAHRRLAEGGRAGFVATNTIRENDSRIASLDYVADHGGVIFDAVSTQPWSGDAAVHVSIVNWIKSPKAQQIVGPKVLWTNDGATRLEVSEISTALSPRVDVRTAKPIPANRRVRLCHQGQTPGITSAFEIDLATRDALIQAEPAAAEFIHRFMGGDELLKTLESPRYIIDLPQDELLDVQSIVPKLLKRVSASALPVRQVAAKQEADANAEILKLNPTAKVNSHHANFLRRWWQLGYRRPELMDVLKSTPRYIATSRVASERRSTVFDFIDSSVNPADSLSVVTLADDYSFGILSSSAHRTWLEARCSTLESRLRYTPTTVWDSFPWPQSPSELAVKRVEKMVKDLMALREHYTQLGMTLAQQYDALRQPGASKLRSLHAELDDAVLSAYGFDPEVDLLLQLFTLNQRVASSEPAAARGPGSVFSGQRAASIYTRIG